VAIFWSFALRASFALRTSDGCHLPFAQERLETKNKQQKNKEQRTPNKEQRTKKQRNKI